ncbi:MAG: glycosyltransferase family 39 protein [Candidatus Binatia bacterium]
MAAWRPKGVGRGVALAAAILVLAGLVAVDGGFAGAAWGPALPLAWRVAALGTGLLLLVVALGDGVPRPVAGWTRAEGGALLALTAAAFAVRAWHLDALRALIDEGNSIDNLLRASDPSVSLLRPPSAYVTTMLHPAWQALVVAAAGPTLQAFRLSNAVLGALTVPALWLLARALFDRPTALAAAVVLAGFAPHVHFSRIGLPHVGDALLGTLALAGVAHGLAGGGRSAWALGGVALGLTHYGFEGGRWFFTPLVATWLAVQAVSAPARLRGARAGIATLALACVLTLLPLYGAGLAGGAAFAPRLRTSALGGGEALRLLTDLPALRARLALAAGVYLWEPERAEYYGGDEALVTPLLAPFAILGVGLCAWRPRAPAVLIPLWVAAAWLANVAMRDPAVYARWVVVLPALALAVGRGACAAVAWASGPALRRHGLATAALVAALAVVPVHGYFARHIERLAAQARAAKPYPDAIDAALRAAAAVARRRAGDQRSGRRRPPAALAPAPAARRRRRPALRLRGAGDARCRLPGGAAGRSRPRLLRRPGRRRQRRPAVALLRPRRAAALAVPPAAGQGPRPLPGADRIPAQPLRRSSRHAMNGSRGRLATNAVALDAPWSLRPGGAALGGSIRRQGPGSGCASTAARRRAGRRCSPPSPCGR